ncbi:Guanyl-specific ribonuclease Sa [Dyella sp. OK004]|uniref:ribonuclease domain-containing protein n=1 Tax=Dyella sp. OK004 TaxID=1855292 RepID=UPI0008E1323F|nr:ribonuclease domain-containing protein [Dyella sp. OK004]SFS02408.1 Guanyl-specific ribonuclease Sa [Dyella sp. OK004]
MRPLKPAILIIILAVAALLWNRHPTPPPTSAATPTTAPNTAPATTAFPSFLPPEARDVIQLIQRGGPFAHRQDGTVFGNREGRLPSQPNGYYHEYTVETPGLDYRGARRIITGGNPPVIYYYTDDHYRTFQSFQVNR